MFYLMLLSLYLMRSLTAILREAWNTSQQTEDRREKIQALSLAKECYSMKLDLLTNATVVDDAIRFVAGKSDAKVQDTDVSKENGIDSQQTQVNEQDHLTTNNVF